MEHKTKRGTKYRAPGLETRRASLSAKLKENAVLLVAQDGNEIGSGICRVVGLEFKASLFGGPDDGGASL